MKNFKLLLAFVFSLTLSTAAMAMYGQPRGMDYSSSFEQPSFSHHEETFPALKSIGKFLFPHSQNNGPVEVFFDGENKLYLKAQNDHLIGRLDHQELKAILQYQDDNSLSTTPLDSVDQKIPSLMKNKYSKAFKPWGYRVCNNPITTVAIAIAIVGAGYLAYIKYNKKNDKNEDEENENEQN